ncbi:MAG: DUF1194 domain-containing protein [Oscillatoriales cyanobacterium RU_3_3]|nr:DUF1194 domain-containing protein [Oscillatoriales cyanobacterium RU_3_3]NJR26099.1 DUF1194 domain-containing protein [Richelia sp. CSU_2_1]
MKAMKQRSMSVRSRSCSIPISALAGVGLLSAPPALAASLIPVNLELQLLIDASGSISRDEYNLMLKGYRSAFINLAPRFGAGGFGDVAVNTVVWSSKEQQQIAIPWFLINNTANAIEFANTIGSMNRGFDNTTAPGTAINFAVPLFANNQFEGKRWVINVSGDNKQNEGDSTPQARDRALAMGVTAINGLPLLNDDTNLLNWYQNNLVGGQNSFAIAANDFTEFGTAIEAKLAREMQPSEPVPEPTTIFGTLAFGAVASWWRIKRKSIGN